MVEWHGLTADQALARLGAGRAGLAPDTAAERLRQHGRNELAEPAQPGWWTHLARQFRSVFVLLLIAAAALSAVLGEWTDCLVIVAILILNAAIGAIQERAAERSLAALRRLSAPLAKVRRAGAVTVVPAAEVVPGDVIVLEAGDLVAADALLLESASLACVEKALTGESEPAAKRAGAPALADAALAERFNMVHFGTTIAAGSGAAVVVATGMNTEVGAIARLIQQSGREPETPLQARLRRAAGFLVWIAVGIVLAMFGVGLLRGEPLLELTLTSVSLAVAAVPEGLPAIVTVALALGVRRMARRRALIRRLPAVETLGCTGVICVDKTGTLTVGQMTVRALWTRGVEFEVSGAGYGPAGEARPLQPAPPGTAEDLALNLAGCGDAGVARRDDGEWDAVGDPTEAALLVAAGKLAGADGSRAAIDAAHPRLAVVPFDAERKRVAVLRAWRGGARVLVNGAPEAVLARCERHLDASGAEQPIDAAARDRILAQNAAWAARALRVIACARRDLSADAAAAAGAQPDPDALERGLVFVGLAGMSDPPRPAAREAVRRCRTAGIRAVMITGDQPRTAEAIARDLGLLEASGAGGVMAGAELARLSDAELRERVVGTAVFARATAADKLRIVRAWQARGAVVAMTGDGVNDAPALRGADVGVAMGRAGTEVAKQAADIVITDDDFATIVAAVEEGRGVYDNVRKTLQYLLGGNAAELLFLGACLLAGLPSPLLPVQILWINLVTDGLPALLLAADPVARDVMHRRPRPRDAGLMDRSFLLTMSLTAVLTAALALGVYLHGLSRYDEATARTHAFAALVFAELLRSFGCRSATLPLWRSGLRSNLLLLAVVAVTFLAQVWSHHEPALANLLKTTTIDWRACAVLMLLALAPLAALEVAKTWAARRQRRRA